MLISPQKCTLWALKGLPVIFGCCQSYLGPQHSQKALLRYKIGQLLNRDFFLFFFLLLFLSKALLHDKLIMIVATAMFRAQTNFAYW